MTPLTGEVAIDGELTRKGIDLAVAEINAAGGIGGRPIQVKLEDGACDPAATASAAQKLITADKVIALEGAFCSSATAAVLPIASRAQVPFVSSLSTAADLTEQGNDWFSRFAPTEALMAAKATPALIAQLGIRKASILTFNDDYGLSYAAAYDKELRAAGIEIASSENFGANTQDYAPFITKIKSSGADTVFVAADTGPEAAVFKQMAQLGLTTIKKVSAQVAVSQAFIDLATQQGAEGIYATTPYVSASTAPSNAGFVTAFMARYSGEMPESDAAGGYMTVYLLADALRRSGGQGGRALQDAIRATAQDTVRGRLTFDAKGQGYADFFIAQITTGKITVFKQLPLTPG
ncbi:MAG: ABC transporter substrate-binding protein [Chloroflexi bacterium]|nr:ABC transporter substrate-binding protein [Chloroflexota bacterium]